MTNVPLLHRRFSLQSRLPRLNASLASPGHRRLYWSTGSTYARSLAPPALQSTLQGVFGGVNSLGGFLGNLIGGYVFEDLGSIALWVRICFLSALCLDHRVLPLSWAAASIDHVICRICHVLTLARVMHCLHLLVRFPPQLGLAAITSAGQIILFLSEAAEAKRAAEAAGRRSGSRGGGAARKHSGGGGGLAPLLRRSASAKARGRLGGVSARPLFEQVSGGRAPESSSSKRMAGTTGERVLLLSPSGAAAAVVPLSGEEHHPEG